MTEPLPLEELSRISKELKIGDYARHVFLCVGESCCSKEAGDAAWTKLKDTLKARNLSLAEGATACYRTKVGCLRVCKGGPILLVYPEGYWYAGMTEDKIDEFIERQIVQGVPIDEWIFARNELPNKDLRS